jgi:hypothetical protein
MISLFSRLPLRGTELFFFQDARQRVSERKSILFRQIDPSDKRSQKTHELTFSKLCEDFYVPHAKQHKKTWQEVSKKLMAND